MFRGLHHFGGRFRAKIIEQILRNCGTIVIRPTPALFEDHLVGVLNIHSSQKFETEQSISVRTIPEMLNRN